MSKRSDVIDGRKAATEKYGLVYTEVPGWVDWAMPRGTDIRNLLAQMTRGETSGKAFYDVRYAQGVSGLWGQVRSGKVMTWRIKRGRYYFEHQSIALAMVMTMARRFEAFQGAFPANLVTDSGFSGEDLVSDLLGFYRVLSTPNPFPLLRSLSKAEALKRWDFYGKIGNWKNETFQPLLFPDPEKFPHAPPRKGVLPPFMNTAIPYKNFQAGNVIAPRHDKTFVILGAGNGRRGL